MRTEGSDGGSGTSPTHTIHGDWTTRAERLVVTAHPSHGGASIASVSRQVADLERAVAFYTALGFERDTGDTPEWEADEILGRLHDTQRARWRTATMRVPSAVSGRPFPLVLREYADVERRD